MDRKLITNLLKECYPKGSQLVMSASAYMTDDTWLKLVPTFAKGIRQMEVIKDHPDWWMTLTCDGFSSHAVRSMLQTLSFPSTRSKLSRKKETHPK